MRGPDAGGVLGEGFLKSSSGLRGVGSPRRPMGCVSSKQFHGGDDHGDGKPRRRPSSNSLKRLVSYSSSKRHEELEEEDEEGAPVPATSSSSAARRVGNDASTARLIRKPPAPVVEAVPALPEEAVTLAVGAVDAERAVAAATGNRKRPPVDVQVNGVAEQESRSGGLRPEGEAKPRIRDVPNGVQGEHVAAGWPRWLTEVAAEAVRGWQPRRAESFEKLDKVCNYDDHYFCDKFIIFSTVFLLAITGSYYELLPIGHNCF